MIEIIYFSSGDFGVPTLNELITDCKSNIRVRGVVTSKDKVHFNDERIFDIASKNDIPCIIPNNDDELQKFLNDVGKVDLYCVISYKKLSNRILSLVNGNAINIHASVLPFLRGAAPINWAIRLGFKQTGLTAFKLSDKIDQGDILKYEITDIYETDNYETLFKRLSAMCTKFAPTAIVSYMEKVKNNTLEELQQQINIGVKNHLLNAPKVTHPDYWSTWDCMTEEEINNLYKSTTDGLHGVLKVYHRTSYDVNFNPIYSIKIWDYEFVKYDWKWENRGFVHSDGKNYLYVPINHKGSLARTVPRGFALSIKEIQVEGRKRMSIEEFLRGFKYFRKDDYLIDIASPHKK